MSVCDACDENDYWYYSVCHKKFIEDVQNYADEHRLDTRELLKKIIINLM